MYKISIPKNQISELWHLREFAARGPIARQIREAIDNYLEVETARIGSPIKDVADVILQHEQESTRE